MSTFPHSGNPGPTPHGPAVGNGKIQPQHHAAQAPGGPNAIPEEEEFDIRAFFGILWGRIGLILFCVIIFGAMGVFQLRRAQASYSATAVIKYEPRLPGLTEMREMSSFLYQRDEMATAAELIRSPAIAIRVLEALDAPGTGTAEAITTVSPDRSPLARLRDAYRGTANWVQDQLITFEPDPPDPNVDRQQGMARRLLSGVSVRRRGDTKLIEIRYSGSSNSHVARVANEFANQFILNSNDENRQAFSYARDYLNTQIDETKIQLEQSERALFDFSGQSDLRVLNEELNIAIGTLTDINREVEGTRNEIALLQAREQAAQIRDYWPLLLDDDGFYGALRRRLVDLQIQRETLAAENEPRWPAIRQIESEILGIQTQVDEATERALLNTSSHLQIAQLRLSSLENRLEQQRLRVRDLEEQMITFRFYQREVETSRAIFDNLLNQYKRLEATDDIAPSNVTIVESAMQPQTASGPNIVRTLGMFLFIGTGLGIGLAFGLNRLDRSVRNPNKVEEKLRLPSLGFIPYVGRFHKKSIFSRGKRPLPPLIDTSSREHQAEAFHYLRTSIQFSTAVHAPQTLLITSCLPQEGKSTISTNLASFFASRGEKVLLIDADLKKPMVHRIFKVPRSPGLSDILAGQATADQAIVPASSENLDVLPVGTATPSPINLLDSQAMSDLLTEMRASYSMIIVDSAPCYGMADSLVVASKVDGVCIVVKVGSTPMEVLQKATEKLRFVGANILGIVYNSSRYARASARGGGYGGYGYYGGHGYGYYGSYGYGYSYGEKEDTSEGSIPSKSVSRQDKTKV